MMVLKVTKKQTFTPSPDGIIFQIYIFLELYSVDFFRMKLQY